MHRPVEVDARPHIPDDEIDAEIKAREEAAEIAADAYNAFEADRTQVMA